jgi:hypothetical protein
MINFYDAIKDRIVGKAPKGAKRASGWRKVRKQHLKNHPRCYVCGSKKKIEVHHIVPFHVAPDLELEPDNMMTLCERKKYGINCHLLIGHFGNYQRVNTNCRTDAVTWRSKLGYAQKALEDDLNKGRYTYEYGGH